MAVPTLMPVISRNVPAFTNDDNGGATPASNANNDVYGSNNYWRCATTPAGNANSGNLTQAVYLAYDISGVPSGQRQNVIVVWYNDPLTDSYDGSLVSFSYNDVPANYTIDTNTAAGGGAPPGSGWSTAVTVTNNPYQSRQHAINLAGANWVRINVTAITGSVLNNNVALNMDIHDVHVADEDNFIFFGDSITQRGFDHDDFFIPLGTLPQQIHALRSNYPLIQDGGIGGVTAAFGASNIATWIPLFPGKYVGLNYGTNDASQGGGLVTGYLANMTTMVTAILGAGKIPIVQKTIPWGTNAGILANGPTLNAALATLFATYPQIIQGPDLWAFFLANPSLISNDGIHPTEPILSQGNGYPQYRTQWARSLLFSIYPQSRIISSVTAAIIAEQRRQVIANAALSIAIQPSNATVFVRRGQQTSYSTAAAIISDDYSPISQGDTIRPFAPLFLERQADGTYQALNLTGLTPSMLLIPHGQITSPIKTCAGTWIIDDATGGRAHYLWQSSDVDSPGIWDMYIKFTNTSGQVQHSGIKQLEILAVPG